MVGKTTLMSPWCVMKVTCQVFSQHFGLELSFKFSFFPGYVVDVFTFVEINHKNNLKSANAQTWMKLLNQVEVMKLMKLFPKIGQKFPFKVWC